MASDGPVLSVMQRDPAIAAAMLRQEERWYGVEEARRPPHLTSSSCEPEPVAPPMDAGRHVMPFKRG